MLENNSNPDSKPASDLTNSESSNSSPTPTNSSQSGIPFRILTLINNPCISLQDIKNIYNCAIPLETIDLSNTDHAKQLFIQTDNSPKTLFLNFFAIFLFKSSFLPNGSQLVNPSFHLTENKFEFLCSLNAFIVKHIPVIGRESPILAQNKKLRKKNTAFINKMMQDLVLQDPNLKVEFDSRLIPINTDRSNFNGAFNFLNLKLDQEETWNTCLSLQPLPQYIAAVKAVQDVFPASILFKKFKLDLFKNISSSVSLSYNFKDLNDRLLQAGLISAKNSEGSTLFLQRIAEIKDHLLKEQQRKEQEKIKAEQARLAQQEAVRVVLVAQVQAERLEDPSSWLNFKTVAEMRDKFTLIVKAGLVKESTKYQSPSELKKALLAWFKSKSQDSSAFILLYDEMVEKDKAEKERQAQLRAEDYADNMSIYEVKQWLKCTDSEFQKWRKAGLIPIKGYYTFYKWGKELEASVHSRKVITAITKDIVEAWRESLAPKSVKALKAIALKVIESDWHMLPSLENYGRKFNGVSVLIKVNWFGSEETWTYAARSTLGFGTFDDPEKLAELNKRFEMFCPLVISKVEAQVTDAIKKSMPENELARLKNFVLQSLKSEHPVYWEILAKEKIAECLKTITKEKACFQISTALSIDAFPDLFEEARAIKRRFIAYVGPTNSGKTYQAMNELAKAKSGCYLAPLRLLALEGRDKLQDLGIDAGLLTGEELVPGTSDHVASTIEMANLNHPVDVAIIDEFQMIYDENRGWAWSNAICGIPAKTVYLCGSREALPAIRELINRLGETLEVIECERKTPLEVEQVPVTDIREGDAIVVFSKQSIFKWREHLKQFHSVSTLYGALTPEVRKSEAYRFAKGETQIVVATDAIGMGLNLPIKRVIFAELDKYDGTSFRKLTLPEILQIGGRAGRFGIHEVGSVGCFNNSHISDVQKAFKVGSPDPYFTKLAIAPAMHHITFLSKALRTKKLAEIVEFFSYELGNVAYPSDLFETADLRDIINWAGIVDKKASSLSLRDKFTYSCVPLTFDFSDDREWFNWMISNHMKNKQVPIGDIMDWCNFGYRDIDFWTTATRLLTSYIWLSFKFPLIYNEVEEAKLELSHYSMLIENYLVETSKKSKPKKEKAFKPIDGRAKECVSCRCKMPDDSYHKYCPDCWEMIRDERRYSRY